MLILYKCHFSVIWCYLMRQSMNHLVLWVLIHFLHLTTPKLSHYCDIMLVCKRYDISEK